MSHHIERIHGREVLDSRGNPTVEVDIQLKDGFGRAIVPSGASTGVHEALELRDNDPNRFLGKGVSKAVEHVNDVIAEALSGKSFAGIKEVDHAILELDGTDQKSKLGANSILGVSMAFAHAQANAEKKPLFRLLNESMGLHPEDMRLPIPMMNVLNGGEHANNGLEIQEFMILPHGFEHFSDSLRAGCEVFQHLKKKIDKAGYSTAVGDEGGFAPDLKTNRQALEIIAESIESAGYRLGKEISLGLDVASSSFFEKGKGYRIQADGKEFLTAEELLTFYSALFEGFPIVSVEDGLDENDWEGWKILTERFGDKLQLVGDDLFVTNKAFVQKGMKNHVANAVLVKVNQIGSLVETFDTMALCQMNNYRCVVSHRSGETEDTTIAHLAVGSGAGQIKTGSLSRGERTAKYNELLRIEELAKREGTPIPFARIF